LSSDLIQPLFLKTEGEPTSIPSMPGCYRLNPDDFIQECRTLLALGITAVALFPAMPDELKDPTASICTNPENLLLKTVARLKEELPELTLITDVAMDPYSSDGHDGYVKDGDILNDETLQILADMAVAQAKAGADMVAPSDMMDGRVGVIRRALDHAGFDQVSIMAYSAKYCSAFYGPFRDALDSAPKGGDKKTYQMNPANTREALREVQLDIEEGADIVMVKPGLPYLDVVHALKERFHCPIAAYHVSGEFAMIKAAAEKGWIDEKAVALESLMAFKRAGADMILTYYAKAAAQWLKTDREMSNS
jgi:porphobilinogen synthase